MRYGVPTATKQVRKTRDGSHEGMLNGAFPAFDSNQIGHSFESDTEVRPDRRADHQVQYQVLRIDLRIGDGLSGLTNVGDAQSVHDVIDQPDDFPGQVTPGQVPVSLKEGVGRASLM